MVWSPKSVIRKHFLAERKRRTQISNPGQSQALENQLLQLNDFLILSRGEYWGAYRAHPGEANMDDFILQRYSQGVNFAFPRIMELDTSLMDFFLIQSWADDFEPHPWGFLEPKLSCERMDRNKLQGIFIPLLAFDKEGNRLGHGNAFYDKYLEGFRGTKVGVAFDWQLSDESIPKEPHDISLDIVVTESQIYSFNKTK